MYIYSNYVTAAAFSISANACVPSLMECGCLQRHHATRIVVCSTCSRDLWSLRNVSAQAPKAHCFWMAGESPCTVRTYLN